MRFAEVSAKEGSSREEGRRGFPWEPESPAAPALNFERSDFCQSDEGWNVVLMWRCRMPDNPEFSLHVHKLMGNARRPALFTIAIWEGTVLWPLLRAAG